MLRMSALKLQFTSSTQLIRLNCLELLTDWLTNLLYNWLTKWLMHQLIPDWPTYWLLSYQLKDWLTDWLTDRLTLCTDWMMHWQVYLMTNWLNEWVTNWLIDTIIQKASPITIVTLFKGNVQVSLTSFTKCHSSSIFLLLQATDVWIWCQTSSKRRQCISLCCICSNSW